MWHILTSLLFVKLCFTQQFTDETFPNPRTNGYNACGLKSRGYICDPYKLLSEQERYRLNNDLLQLSRRTSVSESANFCAGKGVDATLLITKQSDEHLAHRLSTIWGIDGQCKKSVIFVLSTSDHKLYYAAAKHTPISAENIEKIISEQQALLNEGKFTTALTAIFAKFGNTYSETSPNSNQEVTDHGDSGKC
uniref:TPM domain-containing protein n=1 Tax=Setaria digitata TaxID=48799 RepID=A0A915PNL3_9BILA